MPQRARSEGFGEQGVGRPVTGEDPMRYQPGRGSFRLNLFCGLAKRQGLSLGEDIRHENVMMSAQRRQSSAEGDEVNLVNHRDAVKVTWVFKLDGLGANNTSQNFRLTVVDSPAATRISANGTPGSGAYAGYAMFMNMGPTLGNSNPYRLMERGASGDILGTSGNWAPLGNGATTGNAGYANGVTYRYELLMTRNGASLDIVSTMTGGNLNNAGFAAVSLNDASPNSFAFDTFAVRPSNAATTAATFDTSLFQVEYFTPTVPEPASLTLVGLTALAMVVRRRR